MSNFTPQQIEEFLQEFFDVVGARQYVGARYVPIFGRTGEDTIEWDDLAPYEPLTVVMHQGVSYVSRRYVPAGIQITDTAYWVETYRFNAQVEQYRQEVLGFADDIADRVPFPDPDFFPKFGTLGQVLSTLADGTTKWDDPVTVTAEIAAPIIEDWLDEHPEATTTVPDGSITKAKQLASTFMSWGNLLVPANMHGFTHVDQLPPNSVYATGASVTQAILDGMPEYGVQSRIITFNYEIDANGPNTAMQLLFTNRPTAYFRIGSGPASSTTRKYSYSTPWTKLPTSPLSFDDLSQSAVNHFLSARGTIITNVSPSTGDANTQPINSMAYVASNVTEDNYANMPQYPTPSGQLTRLNFSAAEPQAGVQFFTSSDAAWYRSMSTTTIGPWRKVWPISVTKSDIVPGEALTWGGLIHANQLLGFESANQFPPGTTYAIGASVTEAMISDLPAYGVQHRITTLCYLIDQYGANTALQMTLTSDGRAFFRIGNGPLDTDTQMYPYTTDWRELHYADAFDAAMTNHLTCSIFRKVVCVGDSYTSGYTKLGPSAEPSRSNPDFAWPAYMARLTGQTWVNCGVSGTTALTWQTAEGGLAKAQQSGLAQAYVIGLGLNDVSGLAVGVAEDIGTDNQTFYAQYSKIIRELNAISPRAHVFVQTMPRTGTTFNTYNTAIRTIATAYSSTYKVHLLDLSAYADLYDIPSITSDALEGHYTAAGYQQFAMNLSRIISDYVNSHNSQFFDLYDIPYAINAGED